MSCIYFKKSLNDINQETNTIQFDPSFKYLIFRPTIMRLIPEGINGKFFILWGIFSFIWSLQRKPYEVHILYKDSQVVHYSVVLPKCYKFPFMNKKDIEIGPCWTHPDYRGKGIYPKMLNVICNRFAKNKENAWIFCEENNHASQRGILKAGFSFVGKGEKTKPFGMGLLGKYIITELYEGE